MMGEKEREEMMRRYEAGMREELGKMYTVAGKTAIEKMVGERVREMENKRKVELIQEGVRRRYFQAGAGQKMSFSVGCTRDGNLLMSWNGC